MSNSSKTTSKWEDSDSEALDAVQELSIKTADPFTPARCGNSVVSDFDNDVWYDARAGDTYNTAIDYKTGVQQQVDSPLSSRIPWSENTYNYMSSVQSDVSLETAADNTGKDPPSYYQLQEMNKKPVKHVTRLAPCPSQYHLEEMRDYQALQANPYMLKLATSMCVRDDTNS